MGRTAGAKDKVPRKRKHPIPGMEAVTTQVVKKYGEPLTIMVEVKPSDEMLLRDGVLPRAVYVSGERQGLYVVDMEVLVHGDWVRVKQPFAVVEQTHDVLGTKFDEPFLTSPVFPLHVRRIYEKGTNAKRVMVLY